MILTLGGLAATMASVGEARRISPQTSASEGRTSEGSRSPANLQRGVLESVALRHLNGGYGRWRGPRYPSGPGWSQAQVKRIARKRRAVQRHRAHCKRAKA